MLRPDLDIAEALASGACPRCGRVGLNQISQEELQQARPGDAHQSIGAMDPAAPVRCPGCVLVAGWPAVVLGYPRP